MGIQINGVTDSISAVDGSLSLTGAELASVGGINVSGVVTATTYIVGSGSTSAPSISPSGDSNTGIFFPSADTIAFGEGGAEVARFDSSGRFGIGTNTINAKLEISGNSGGRGIRLSEPSGEELDISAGAAANDPARIATSGGSGIAFAVNGTSGENARIDTSGNIGVGTTSVSFSQFGSNTGGVAIADIGTTNTGLKISDGAYHNYLVQSGNSNFYISHYGASGDMIFSVGSAGEERARIDSSGRLLVGTSSARSNINREATTGITPFAQIETAVQSYNSGLSIINNSASAYGAMLTIGTSYSTSIGSNTIGNSGSQVGTISFVANDGTKFIDCAQIKAEIDATPGANDMPGRLMFSTTADGASSPTERARITSDGYFKASNNGNYSSIVVTGHQFYQTASEWNTFFVSTSATPYGIYVRYTGAAPNGSSNQFLTCYDNGPTLRAEIRSNGGLANYSANNSNLSDINAKKDISPAADTWDCIKEWEIVNYRYKDQPDDADLNLGVIAQQVAESCPEVITVFEEAKDDQPEKLGVKEQQMYWMAIKALQEAQERIEALETENSTLKSQNDSILARLDAAGI